MHKAKAETTFRKMFRYAKWILPPVGVCAAAVIGVEKVSDSMREYATRNSELHLINYYTTRFKIIVGIASFAIASGVEYLIRRYFRRE